MELPRKQYIIIVYVGAYFIHMMFKLCVLPILCYSTAAYGRAIVYRE